MSLVLCIGYALIQITGMRHGYWILLTSLFVCQPNYNATRHRLALRIIGTLVGVAIGLPILWFVPSLEGQLVLLVITGVLFFAFRNVQYAHATMFITLLVLLCFNLTGEGFEVALPRVVDTLIGCAIAGLRSALFGRTGARNLPGYSSAPPMLIAATLMRSLSNITGDGITARPIALPDATRTTAMQNWHPWFLICRANPTSRLKPGGGVQAALPQSHFYQLYLRPRRAPRSSVIRTCWGFWMTRSATLMMRFIINLKTNSAYTGRWRV